MRKLYLPILLGTRHKGRKSGQVADYLLSRIRTDERIETDLLDVATFTFNADEGENLKDLNPAWREAMGRADGLIIVSPEYNHGYPGSLKLALDMLLNEYFHKVVGLVGVSSGLIGGARMIEQLVGVVRELGLTPIITDLYFPKIGAAFEDGKPVDPETESRVTKFLDELVWMAETLRWGRENLPSSHPRAVKITG